MQGGGGSFNVQAYGIYGVSWFSRGAYSDISITAIKRRSNDI